MVGVLAGFLAVWASATVYLIGARPSWRHWSTALSFFACAVSLGVATSLCLEQGWAVAGSGSILAARVVALVGVIGLAVAEWRRMAYLRSGLPEARQTYGLLRQEYRQRWFVGLLLRVALAGVLVVASFFLPGLIFVAWVVLAAGVVLERHLFFVTALPLTLHSEVRGGRVAWSTL
ncbi:MAG: hypothetical protein H5T84_07805 [Thermoleophilia bacterium]|nr:hypothetical protein [Thermoleophilia bacterium]